MSIITPHLDKAFLTSASKFLCSHQSSVTSSILEHLETSYSLQTIKQCVLKVLGWVLSKKRERSYNFDVLKNSDVMVPLVGHWRNSLIEGIQMNVSSNFDSEVFYIPQCYLYLHPPCWKKVFEENHLSNALVLAYFHRGKAERKMWGRKKGRSKRGR